MDQNQKHKLVRIFILALAVYFCLRYFQYEIYVTTESTDDATQSVIESQEWRNPLQVIFLGIDYQNENDFTTYHFVTRMYSLLNLIFLFLIILGTVRFFQRERKINKLFIFVFLYYFWSKIGHVLRSICDYFFEPYKMLNLPSIEANERSFWIFLLELFVAIVLGFVLSYLIKFDRQSFDNRKQRILLSKGVRGMHRVFNICLLYLMGAFASLRMSVFVFNDLLHNADESFMSYFVLSDLICISILFFISEWLFQMTPSNVLSGSHVVHVNDDGRLNVGNYILRTLGRLIPFDVISFLFNRGWHDSISSTTVIYNGAGHWLHRLTRVMRISSIFFMVFSFWLMISMVFIVLDDTNELSLGYAERWINEQSNLPLYICVFFLPFFAMIFSSWLAALNNHSENEFLKFKEASKDRGSYVFQAMLWWVPIANFIMPGFTLNNITGNYDASEINDGPKVQRLKSASTLLKWGFGLFYIFLLVSLSLVIDNGRSLRYAGELIFSIFLLLFSFSVFMFSRAASKLNFVDERITADELAIPFSQG